MKGEAYVKGWINIFSKPIFCLFVGLTLVNQSYFFFPFDAYFFHIQTGNNKILQVFFFSFFFFSAQVDVSTK